MTRFFQPFVIRTGSDRLSRGVLQANYVLKRFAACVYSLMLWCLGMSAAGLYESVANVPVAEPAAVQSAACTVWASLFSRRAVLARKVAGIPQVSCAEFHFVMELATRDCLGFICSTARVWRHCGAIGLCFRFLSG